MKEENGEIVLTDTLLPLSLFSHLFPVSELPSRHGLTATVYHYLYKSMMSRNEST